MGDLAGEELEEAVQLVQVAARLGHQRAGSASVGSSERTSSWSRSRKRSTRPSTRTASPSWKRRSSSSTSFQTRRLDPPARIDELEREVRAAAAGAQALLAGDREDRPRRPGPPPARRSATLLATPALYGRERMVAWPPWPLEAVSRAPLRPGTRGLARRPRRPALRRDLAGAARASSLAASPYNAVRLSARMIPRKRPTPRGLAGGGRARARRRAGRLGARGDVRRPGRSARAPGAASSRAHAARAATRRARAPSRADVPGAEGARLRLLRATRTKLSPISLLHEGASPAEARSRAPDLEADARRRQEPALADRRPGALAARRAATS